jgi:protein-disulfide isomerase
MIAGISALVGVGGYALGARQTAPVNPNDKAGVEAIVRAYVLAHPEIIPEAMDALKSREATKAVVDNRSAIETPFGNAWEGAANGDVTLVEFYDYACGYCRQSVADVAQLLAEDKKLRVVYREMPVLGDSSVGAARISLALARSGNFGAFHRALYGGGHLSDAGINDAITKAGGNPAGVLAASQSPAIEAELAQVSGLQRALNLSGTPSWVVGDKVLIGAVGYDELKGAIAEARKKKS